MKTKHYYNFDHVCTGRPCKCKLDTNIEITDKALEDIFVGIWQAIVYNLLF